jgi:hypothetical protein
MIMMLHDITVTWRTNGVLYVLVAGNTNSAGMWISQQMSVICYNFSQKYLFRRAS